MAGLTDALPAPRPRRLELQGVLCTLVLAAVALCVVFPLLLVALQSLQVAPPGQPARYGLDGWRAALGEPGLRAALVNTLTVTFARQLISLPLAVLIAWLLARTDLPGRSWIEFAFWAAFFLPPFTVTLSWILLLDPEYGLVNTSIAALPLVGAGPFNIYSFWGIVWVHIVTGSLTVKVILLTPAFRNMNAAFEEASRVAGAGTLRTALRITVPVMAPAILSVLLLGTMVSLQTFEVEQVLGLPFRFFVFSTTIYDLLVTRVPRYDAATALAVVILAAMLPLVFAQQWLTRGRRYTTVTGQFQSRVHALGRARGPVTIAVLALVVVVLGVPVAFALLGTFMKLFGFFHVPDPWTLANWQTVLGDELFLRSLHNTLVLSIGTAVAAILVHSLIAYIIVRTTYAGTAPARLRLLAAVHGPGHHPGPGPALALPRGARPAAALRDHRAPDHRGGHRGHAARRADHPERAHAARRRAGGGLADRGRVLVDDVSADHPAVDGPDPARGGHDHVRRAPPATSATSRCSPPPPTARSRSCSSTTWPSASSRRRWWWPASSCSSRWPVPCSPACSGCAAGSAEESPCV